MTYISQIALRNLTFSYNAKTVFNQLHFQANAGFITQLVGNNGSGKTTLLKILAGIILPECDPVFINNFQEKSVREEFQQQIRYIGHQPALKLGLTLAENMQYDSYLYNGSFRASFADVLQKWELFDHKDRLVNNLSFGQQRKLGLLRLIFFPGKVWLLDEPFVGLDTAAQQLLAELLHVHVQNQGIVVLSSHQRIESLNSPQTQLVKL